jgi:ABC-type polysaccharide/polyol phosphate transport system ATPase subunit
VKRTVTLREAPPFAVSCQAVWKQFRIPLDRPRTAKQRILHPSRSRAARDLDALRDVSFEIGSGDFFGIIGRNGSGKSTLLKCLAGIYLPTKGTVTLGGRVSPFIELGVGFNPELTALDNIVVNAALLGIPPKEARDSFREIVRFAELEEFEQLKLKNYSSGMYVRLGFAAAIQAEADIYLVDEVLAVGDARFQDKCFDTFRQLRRRGKTVIYVTHDLATVERLCDHALLLERGEAVAVGSPHDVIQTYRQRNLEDEQAEAVGQEPLLPTRRWGDGAAEVLDAWFESEDGVRSTAMSQGSRAIFKAHIRFHRPMDEPVFGVIIKNDRGDHVFVTNTMFDQIRTGTFAAGDEAVYSVAFALELADGRHTASPAVAYQDAQRFADWQEEIAGVAVRGERLSGGIVDLAHETDIERQGSASENELQVVAEPRQGV